MAELWNLQWEPTGSDLGYSQPFLRDSVGSQPIRAQAPEQVRTQPLGGPFKPCFGLEWDTQHSTRSSLPHRGTISKHFVDLPSGLP